MTSPIPVRVPVVRHAAPTAPASVCGSPERLSAAAAAARVEWPVALVTMPFALATRPSLQLGLLAAIARTHGFGVTTLHLNLDFVARIGGERYHHLACTRNPMFGDWLFARAAFGDDVPDGAGTLPDDVAPLGAETLAALAMTTAELRAWRDELAPAYVDAMVEAVDWSAFRIVGFTSTFQQNVASFALARRIKAEHPDVVTLFGGANFDGPMGRAWLAAISAIDYAISGEADRAFAQFLIACADGTDPLAIPGVIGRRAGAVVVGPPAIPFEELDALPVPDYGEYFERARTLGIADAAALRDVHLPFESSRGCWWGERATCRFCGLNGATMRFRAKSPARVRDELTTLARRHRHFSFNAADNILDLERLRPLLTQLAADGADYALFYEVKADLARADVRLLHQAGVRTLQPGIESLSTRLLRLMQKGTRASTNVNLLRWARYYGIACHWNVLFGFPGEAREDYDVQARLARQLVHLDPPGGYMRIGLERFSPYFEQADRFPVRDGPARPEPGYAQTYPPHVDLAQAAYHFAGELEGSLVDAEYDGLVGALRAWHDRARLTPPPTLYFRWSPGVLHVEDCRSSLTRVLHTYDDPAAGVYAACSDAPMTVPGLARQLALSQDALAPILGRFCASGLMLRDGGLYLALALPATAGR